MGIAGRPSRPPNTTSPTYCRLQPTNISPHLYPRSVATSQIPAHPNTRAIPCMPVPPCQAPLRTTRHSVPSSLAMISCERSFRLRTFFLAASTCPHSDPSSQQTRGATWQPVARAAMLHDAAAMPPPDPPPPNQGAGQHVSASPCPATAAPAATLLLPQLQHRTSPRESTCTLSRIYIIHGAKPGSV